VNEAVSKRGRGRPPLYPTEWWVALANRFIELERQRVSRKSSREVIASEFGIRSASTVGVIVLRCRQKGLIPPAGIRLRPCSRCGCNCRSSVVRT
jgi:hypothetical protein